MLKNQEWASDMMVSTPEYWARVADYILLYDQIVIPTGNLQILSVLRFMLGDAVFIRLVESKCIVLARFDQWFGYIGTGGVGFFRVGDNPDAQRAWPNLATSHFQPLDQSIDSVLIAMNPPTTQEQRARLKNLLLDNVVLLPTETILTGVKEEAYRDIRESPYLCDFLSLRNAGRSIENLVGSKPDTVTVFNPHVPAEKNDSPEIRAVLRVVFENLLLSLGGHTEASELTGDAATLSVLQAKGQRLGYRPHGRQAFAQLQRVAGVPDVGAAFASKQLSPEQIVDLRDSKHAQALRDWLALGSPAETADETVRRYVETIGKPSVVEALPAKILRFATTTAWGALEPVSGAIAAAADTFLLSKWYPGKNPRLFMRQAKVVLANTPVIKSPNMKGRDRNTPCSCGGGKKYKNCCGRLA
ncbi:SEC-C metal-binding domain-containing protein [Polaromonas sp.]|uniref:SEC-C metal-binding domain-containing protein n=1 Tax=Polaromonas sp. TaxID=1869339 RepID=UPI00272F8D17|nr:SEC-C metal-binding domain-containing protein [Polaromonas sp.]